MGVTVYIEYAFLENFLLDGALLFLAGRAARIPVRPLRLFFAAALGGAFAVCFPLLSLPHFWKSTLKWAVGLLLPLIACGRVKNKKEWGRYALNATSFLIFTFLFGGALVSVEKPVSTGRIFLAFLLLTAISLFLIEKLYQKRKREEHIYPCALFFRGKRVRVRGFYDSGNLATKKGLPVCFLSADIFYDLFGDTLVEEGGEMLEELCISTLAGEKKLLLRRGEIELLGEKKQAYFACSGNMIAREYKIILHARMFDGE